MIININQAEMKTILLLLALGLAITTFGQVEYSEQEDSQEYSEKDSNKKERWKIGNSNSNPNEIKTLTGNGHNGGFIGFTFKSTEFNQERIVTAGVRTGWIIGRTMGIGFEAHGIAPTLKLDNIIPNEKVILLGGYGGMFLEPIILSNQVIHLTFPIAAGGGWMGYHEDWENSYEFSQLIEEDIYWYVEPGAALEVNVSKNFRIGMGITQRFTQDLELSNTSSNAFDKRNYFLTLKIGAF